MERLRTKLSLYIALASGGMLLSAARPASADLLWSWSYKCDAATFSKCQGGSGTYTSTDTAEGPTGNPYYVLTSITGTVEGNTITSLLPPDSLELNNDNKISAFKGPSEGTPYSHDPSHTVTGIGFLTNNDPPTVANRNNLAQVFQDYFTGDYTQIAGPNGLSLTNVDFSAKLVGQTDPTSPTPVPESSTLTLLGTGILGVAGAMRRKLFA
jgi:hypothetical protein